MIPLCIWLTLAIGAIGFGGMFSVYTYLANTLLSVTHVREGLVPPGTAPRPGSRQRQGAKGD